MSPRISRTCFVLLTICLAWFAQPTLADSPPKSDSSATSSSSTSSTKSTNTPTPAPQCQSLSIDFDFAKQPPAKTSELTFCKEYKSATCCDKSHTMTVLRSLSPLFADNEVGASFSERCRQVSSTVACAPCHPDVGTRRRIGVCPSLCDDWYHACYNALYTEVDGIIRPCTESSLVCAPLSSIVHSGQDFCRLSGVGAGSVHASKQLSFSDQIQQLIKAEATPAAQSDDAVDDEIPYCFDGSSRSQFASSNYDASSPSSSSSSSGSSGRKRYYKSADELAEIERKKRAREEARAQREFENQPAMKLARAFADRLSQIMTPINRTWSRIVRSLPLPRQVQRNLETPFVFSLIMCFLNILVYRVWSRWMEMLCGKCCKRKVLTPSSVNASLSGLSPEVIRQLRAEKLMQQQYMEANSTESSEASASKRAPAGTYTTVIDGEIVHLPE